MKINQKGKFPNF